MSKISLSYPESWLAISISIKNRDTWIEVFTWSMTEVDASKVYIYDFQETIETDYVYVATVTGYTTMSGTIYRDGGWLTTEQTIQLFDASTRPASIVSGNTAILSNLKSTITKWNKEIIEKIEEDGKITRNQLSENDSHISLAFDTTIDTIKESEKEICTDVKKTKSELKEDNVATRNLVRQKTKKIDENTQKLVDSDAKTQKMLDDEFEEIEQALEQVDEEEITKAIEQADKEHEQNIIEALNNL